MVLESQTHLGWTVNNYVVNKESDNLKSLGRVDLDDFSSPRTFYRFFSMSYYNVVIKIH